MGSRSRDAAASSMRTAPPSGLANNQDVFVWALYVLGGADRDVDVEEVYFKSFELAPARLGWRTRPDIPDYKKTAKALQSVEANTHVGLVHRTSPYLRRLTADGARWVEQHRHILERVYGGERPVPAASANMHERRRREVRQTTGFALFVAGQPIPLVNLAAALDCSPASPRSVWDRRVIELERVAEVLGDKELARFVESARETMRSTIE
jgi:hypothetical protein